MDNEKIFYLHQFSIPDNLGILKKDTIVYPLRYMSGNDNITEKDQDDLITYMKKIINERIEGVELE